MTHPSNPHPPGRRRPRGWRRIAFPIAAVLIGLLPFVLLEGTLALFDAGNPRRGDDPFVGFSATHPLFNLDEEGQNYVTAVSRQLAFGRQHFAAHKPPGGFRIFCLGGSTVRGRPFETDTAFPEWLRLELAGGDSTRTYEAVNCGGVSYASYRLRLVADEVLDYRPDLLVLATGHNEFLEDRTYHEIKERSAARSWLSERVHSLRSVTLARQWLRPDETVLSEDVKARLDQESGYASYHRDKQWRAGVIEHYRVSVRRIVTACRERGVPILLVDLGSNLRDCPPFKSEHKAGLSAEQKKDWEFAFAAGTKADREATTLAEAGVNDPGALEKALRHYRRAEAIDDEYALLAYHIARCLDQQGKRAEARRYYLKAQEEDICPLRMLGALHEKLEEIADEMDVPLVRVRERIERQSADGLPGSDWYVDHVHPAIAGHQLIARALVERMGEEGLLPDSFQGWNEKQRRAAYRAHFRSLSPTFFTDSRRRIGWLEHWARVQRLQEEIEPVDGPGFLRRGHRELEIGREEDAWRSYGMALTADPSLADPLLDHACFLVAHGRPERARGIVERLLQASPSEAQRRRAHLAELVIALEEGERRKANELYRTHREELEALEGGSDPWLALRPDALGG
jgi:tetratricopeptide (TPR) repeat protein